MRPMSSTRLARVSRSESRSRRVLAAVASSVLARARGTGRSPPAARSFEATSDTTDRTGVPHVGEHHDRGPLQRHGRGRHAQPRQHSRCRPTAAPRKRRARGRSSSTLARRRIRRPVTTRTSSRCWRSTGTDGARAASRTASSGARAAARRSRVPVPRRAGARRTSPRRDRYRISDLELASRLSFFLWSSIPDDELLDAGERGQAERSGSARASRCGACWPIRAPTRWSRTSPASGCTCATCRRSRPDRERCSRISTRTCAQALRRETELFFESIMREDRSVARAADGRLHVPQRAAGPALRDPERLRQPVPARRRSTDEPRAGLLGQGSILTVTSYADPHVAGASRQVDCSRTFSARRRRRRRRTCRRSRRRARRRAPDLSVRERIGEHRENPVVRDVPRADGSAGVRARELRRDRHVARRSTEASAPIDASGVLPDGPQFDGAGELRQALVERAGRVRRRR